MVKKSLTRSKICAGTAATSLASQYYFTKFVKFSNLILKDNDDGFTFAILHGLGLLLISRRHPTFSPPTISESLLSLKSEDKMPLVLRTPRHEGSGSDRWNSSMPLHSITGSFFRQHQNFINSAPAATSTRRYPKPISVAPNRCPYSLRFSNCRDPG